MNIRHSWWVTCYSFSFFHFSSFFAIDYAAICRECSSTILSVYNLDFAHHIISCCHCALLDSYYILVVSYVTIGQKDAFIFVFQCRRILSPNIKKLEKCKKDGTWEIHIAEIWNQMPLNGKKFVRKYVGRKREREILYRYINISYIFFIKGQSWMCFMVWKCNYVRIRGKVKGKLIFLDIVYILHCIRLQTKTRFW